MSTGTCEPDPGQPDNLVYATPQAAYLSLVEGIVLADISLLWDATHALHDMEVPLVDSIWGKTHELENTLFDHDLDRLQRASQESFKHVLGSWVCSGVEIDPGVVRFAADMPYGDQAPKQLKRIISSAKDFKDAHDDLNDGESKRTQKKEIKHFSRQALVALDLGSRIMKRRLRSAGN